MIKTQTLTLSYDGAAVVHDLTFAIDSGDYLCIVGENGSGKSTLVKALLGLKAPASGKIEYTDGMTRRDIGYLPQRTDVGRGFPASVAEVILSGTQNRGKSPFYTRADRSAAADAAERMGITHLYRRSFSELSGGQQQRVLLARALCASRRLLLLDEPTAGLDPKVTAELYEIIASLNRDSGITVVMVSHDIDAAMTYATKILHLGHTSFFGTVDEYAESELGKKYLGGCE